MQDDEALEGVSARRMDWLDAAKGAAIALVVIGQVWRGLHNAEILTDARLFRLVDDAIYLFHMDAFFLISGSVAVLFGRGRSPGTLTWRLLYPLVLWTYVYLAAKALAGDAVNTPLAVGRGLLPLPPVDHHWFLWALLLLSIAGWPLLRLAAGAMAITASAIAALGLLAVAAGVGAGPWFGAAVHFAPAYFLGIAAGAAGLRWASAGVALAGAALFVACQALSVLGVARLSLPCAAGFIIAFAALSPRMWGGAAAGRLLQSLGRGSMAIFLTHVFAQAGSRILLLRLGVDDLAVHLVVGVTLGLALPTAFALIVERLGAKRLLGF